MDPELLIHTVLDQIFKTPPFLEMSSGQTSHLHQIFVIPDSISRKLPTFQELFEKSFTSFGIKLKKSPQVLILQAPRSGDHKFFDAILPSLKLNITDVIDKGN